MLRCATKNFGVLEYDAGAVVTFPRGLPGFESETSFVPIEQEASKPALFLQSVVTPKLCFIALPMESIDPAYQLKVSDEDLQVIGAGARESESLRCLAVVCAGRGRPTANLLGPIVINQETRQAVQAVRDDARYAVEHPLLPEPEAEECL
ncbi:MAG: flagellar assembly protein FliW [Bryobacteraceae bacterium]